MTTFSVWAEGYFAQGMDDPAPARLIGSTEADTFKEACDKLCSSPAWQAQNGHYDSQRGTVWGCHLYDNETDARRFLG